MWVIHRGNVIVTILSYVEGTEHQFAILVVVWSLLWVIHHVTQVELSSQRECQSENPDGKILLGFFLLYHEITHILNTLNSTTELSGWRLKQPKI